MSTTQAALLEALTRCVKGIEHLSELARQWEPDHSSGADRRGWLLAQDAKDDAKKLIEAAALRAAEAAQPPNLRALQPACRYISDVLKSGTATEKAVARKIMHLLPLDTAEAAQPEPVGYVNASALEWLVSPDRGNIAHIQTGIFKTPMGNCNAPIYSASAQAGVSPAMTRDELVAAAESIGMRFPVAAQAGPAQAPLTDEQIGHCIDAANRKFNGRRQGPCGQQMTTYDDWKYWLVREVEIAHGIAAQAPASTRPEDASISGQRVDVAERPTADRVKSLADKMASAYAARDIPTGQLYRGIAEGQWTKARAALFDAIDALAAAPQAPAEQQKPIGNFAVSLGDLSPAEKRCACGNRPASQCPGEWEPGCDLGANEKHAKVAPAEPAAQAVEQDAALPVHEVWREGYRITGETARALKLGEARAFTFEEACDIVCADMPGYSGRAIWGCRLFNNEADARRSFG